MTDLQKEAAAYIVELDRDSPVSYSHFTLRRGRKHHGEAEFDAEVDRQFAARKAADKA